MGRPLQYDVDPIDVDTDGIAENQKTAGAANLVLNGALADLGTALIFDMSDAGYSSGIAGVKISIDSAGDVSSVIFTITGKDENGFSQTETITNVTTTAVNSTKFWSYISNIAADSEVTSNVFIGPINQFVTKTIPLNYLSAIGATVAVTGLSGTIQYDMEECFGSLASSTEVQGQTYFVNQSNKTADVSAVLTVHATGVRLRADSYSSGAELQFHVNHPIVL
jgi:hypothetical protein